ncbi:MAG: hypothetical protein ABIK99_03950 [candidate division WOR-3 bacterium]
MCCNACVRYAVCVQKNELRDDCCSQCRYFDSCMELTKDEKRRDKFITTKKRYPRR